MTTVNPDYKIRSVTVSQAIGWIPESLKLLGKAPFKFLAVLVFLPLFLAFVVLGFSGGTAFLFPVLALPAGIASLFVMVAVSFFGPFAVIDHFVSRGEFRGKLIFQPMKQIPLKILGLMAMFVVPFIVIAGIQALILFKGSNGFNPEVLLNQALQQMNRKDAAADMGGGGMDSLDVLLQVVGFMVSYLVAEIPLLAIAGVVLTDFGPVQALKVAFSSVFRNPVPIIVSRLVFSGVVGFAAILVFGLAFMSSSVFVMLLTFPVIFLSGVMVWLLEYITFVNLVDAQRLPPG
ncbi:MAG: hypothetical protein RIQ81_1417 [Pseudomonadota bacterium]